MKKILKMLFNRVVLVGLAILVQVLLLILMVVKFQEYFVYFYAMCTVLSMAVVLIIVNGNSNPGYKIAWLIPVLLVILLIVVIRVFTSDKGKDADKTTTVPTVTTAPVEPAPTLPPEPETEPGFQPDHCMFLQLHLR